MKEQCHNSLHAAALILCDPVRFRRVQIMTYTSVEFRLAHFREQESWRGPDTMIRYYVGLAKGCYAYQISRTFKLLQDPGLMRKLGIARACNVCAPTTGI